MLRLRYLAEMNPPTVSFMRLPDEADVTFLPLEAVWSASNADLTRVRRKTEVSTGYVRCANGDVLLPKTAPTFGHGRAMVADGLRNGVAAGSTELHVVRPRPGCDPRFLAYAFRSDHFLAAGKDAYQGVAGLQRVPEDFVADWRIAVTAPQEQRRTADFLDDQVGLLDRVLALRAEQVRLLRHRVEAATAEDVLRLGRDHGWLSLRRVLRTVVDGPFGSSLTSEHYADEGARVIRLGNLGTGNFKAEDEAFIPLSHFETLRQHEVREGDLLVAGLGDQNNPLGRACLAPEGLGPAIVKADCYRVRLQTDVVSHEFAALVLSSEPVTEETALLTRGATRARLNTEVARDIRLPVPPLAEQDAFVRRVAAERAALAMAEAACTRSVMLLQERKRALISAAVSGEFDVTTAGSVR